MLQISLIILAPFLSSFSWITSFPPWLELLVVDLFVF